MTLLALAHFTKIMDEESDLIPHTIFKAILLQDYIEALCEKWEIINLINNVTFQLHLNGHTI